MAKSNQKKRRSTEDYNSLLNLYSSKNTINTASDAKDEASDYVENDGGVNNISEVLRREQGQPFGRLGNTDNPGVAPLDSTDNRARSITSTLDGGGSLDGRGEASNNRTPFDIRHIQSTLPESSLPSFVREDYGYPESNTPMYGGMNAIPNIKTLLAPDEEPAASHYGNIIAAAVNKAPGVDATFAPGSPEAKLSAALANTNPAPRSFWRRFAASLAEGASQVRAGDTPGSMLGKIVGNVIPGLIPGVDSHKQYEENKAKALEQYGIESGMRKNAEAAKKAEQDIKESNERIAAGASTRAANAANAQILNQTRLDNVTKGRADQLMTALSKLPENDPQRDALAKVLASPPYNIDVGRNYGLLAKEEKEATQTAKTNAQATKPLTESDLRRKAEATVKASYDWQEKARASTDARLDQIKANIRDSEFKGKINIANRDEYNKRVQAEYNRILKANQDYSRAEYNKQVKAEMDRIRSNEPVTQTSTRVTKTRVAPSNTAKGTNFAGVTIKLPGATK